MTNKIICDNCGASLDDSGPYPSYRTSLKTERMPNLGNTELAVSVSSSIPLGSFDFCDADCLKAWLGTRAPTGEDKR